MLERLTDFAARTSARARRIYAVDVLWRAGQDFADKGETTYAAALAYYVLLSLFPLLIFLAAIFGLMLQDPSIQERVLATIIDRVPAAVNLRDEIEIAIARASRTNNGLVGLVGLLGMAWAASAIFAALREALNRAFDVPTPRALIQGKVADLLGVAAVGFLVLLTIVMTTVLGVIRALADYIVTGWFSSLAWQIVYFLLPTIISFGVFLAAYRLIPNVKARFSELWIGALVAALGLELAKHAFGLYLTHTEWYQQVYGALASVVAFLVFVFIASSIVIFGAEVAAALTKDRQAKAEDD